MTVRPLDRISSIKVKLSIVIVTAVAISAVVSTIGFRVGLPVVLRPLIAAGIALAVAYPIARGLTSPLRQMVTATQAMAAGEPVGPVPSTARDEVGELARSFNDMRAQLDALDQQRRDLVANVSHELRTPISALQATLENLVDGVEPADPELLGTMLEQTERLSRMVEQLLDLSRLEAGVSPLHLQDVALGTMLEQAVREARLQHPDTIVRVAGADGVVLEADPERLVQIVVNLVDNAVRHAPSGTDVVIETELRGEGVVLRVIDQGPGIHPDEAERVFERFYRADRARANAAGGSGLGLAIVRWLVDLHGGSVVVDTAVTDGGCVTVQLPRRSTNGEEPA